MIKRWIGTIGLLLVILLIGTKIVQRALPSAAAPTISFTCAVALHQHLGEVCVKGASWARVSIMVQYCDGSRITSSTLSHPVDGEYRWVWVVRTMCRGAGQSDRNGDLGR